MTVGRDTLLSLLRAVPAPVIGEVTVLGVDDFALRRGQKYGTVIVDMVTRRPIDVLDGRESDPLASWLRDHPDVEIVCRDRAGAYAEGTRAGAPQAIQVADRWHLWHNLGEAVDKTVAAHHACVRAAFAAAATDAKEPDAEIGREPEPIAVTPTAPSETLAVHRDGALDVCGRPRRLVVRTRQRYADVQQHLAAGESLAEIGAVLDLDLETVRRFARATNVEELLVKAINRASLLDGYTEHLDAEYAAGITDAGILCQQIREQGFTGSVQTVRRYLHPLRPPQNSPGNRSRRAPRPVVPKPRHIVRWIMTEEGRLSPEQRTDLDRVMDSCMELKAVAGHVRNFAQMMAQRRGTQLRPWMHAVEADNLPALHSLIVGLRRDEAAVTAGLTLPWSSGPVEGHVNRIKTLKRQMYGRASFPLLRQRILLRT
jgi:transposase